jgi:serpin B
MGETKNEIQRFFHFSQSASDNSMLFNKLNREILAKPNSSSEVNVANALWIQKNFKIKQPFIDQTKTCFNSELFQQDFVKTPKESCDAINRWASEKTNHKITSVIKPSDLNEFPRLILTNSIYFEGKWEDEFDKSRTKDTIFYNSDKTESTVRMMHQASSFNYFEDTLFQTLEIPYEDDYSMIVLLPKSAPADFDKVDFNHQTYQKSISSMTHEDVVLSMPKFDLENEIQLSDVLQANGLKTSFTADANFNEIADANLYIKKCYQSCYISVNEEKTEAAAVGAICVVAMSAISENPPPPKVFNMNHPFVFLIVSRETQTILFLGKIEAM